MPTTKNIQSLERAFSILELFLDSSLKERSLKDISISLDLNKSTAFGLVNTLANLGYLQQNEENQKYSLGLKLLSLTNAIPIQSIVSRIVHPYLVKISQKYGETSHCAAVNNNTLIYLDKIEKAGSASINTDRGTQNYLHCTGLGKVLLAHLPEEKAEIILNSELKALTYNTITSPAALRKELEWIRKNGYAIDNEEISIGITCYAVPIFSSSDTAPFAISVSGITSRVQNAAKNGLLEDLKSIAREISENAFGYRLENKY